MAGKLIALVALAAGFLVLDAQMQQSEARRGGHSGSGGFSGRSVAFTGGGQFRSVGALQFRGVGIGPRQSAIRAIGQAGPRYGSRIAPGYVTKSYQPRYGHAVPKHRVVHHRRVKFVTIPYFYGTSYYSAYDDCYWLYRKAVASGSRYWWDRYYACREDY